MPERRHHKRIRKRIYIRCKNEVLSIEGVTLDFCPGGVFVITNQTLPPKSVIEIELWLNEESPVHCRGVVTWVNRGQIDHYPPGFGAQFLNLTDESEGRIFSSFIEQDQEWSSIPW
jgi:PilZ domain